MRRRLGLISGSPARVLTLAAVLVYLVASASVLFGAGQAPSAAVPRTVWDGVFTADQAERGRRVFAENCAECHGTNLGGGEAKALSGDRFWRDFQEATVDYLLGQISRNMPFSEDGSLAGTLSTGNYQDLVAHILNTNGFPTGNAELTQASSVGVSIVPKDGSAELPASAFARVSGCLARGTSGGWRLTNGSRPARALANSKPDPNVALGDREFPLQFVLTNLEKFVGHRMIATGRLVGPGGIKGLEVSTIDSVSATCP